MDSIGLSSSMEAPLHRAMSGLGVQFGDAARHARLIFLISGPLVIPAIKIIGRVDGSC